MANPDEGEVGFTAKGEAWTISYNNRTLRTLEALLNTTTGKLLTELQSGASITTLSKVFWHGLKNHHNGIGENEACDLVKPGRMVKLVGQALELAFKDDEAADRPPVPSQIIQ